jgi:hypothetical protein
VEKDTLLLLGKIWRWSWGLSMLALYIYTPGSANLALLPMALFQPWIIISVLVILWLYAMAEGNRDQRGNHG